MQRTVWSVGFMLAVTLVGFTTTRPSAACQPPPRGYYAYDAPLEVPTSGVIAVRVGCNDECPPFDQVQLEVKDGDQFVSGTQGPVPGIATTGTERILVWRPAAPLVPGREYTIGVVGQATIPPPKVLVRADLSLDTTAMTRDVELRLQEAFHGPQRCCQNPTIMNSCGGVHEACVAAHQERTLALTVNTSGAGIRQFTQTVTFSTPAGAIGPAATAWANSIGGIFPQAASEYCYQITFTSLIDGTTTTGPLSCVPHGNVGSPGVFATPDPVIAEAIAMCTANIPPEYEDLWCIGRAQLCADNAALCERAGDSEIDCQGLGGLGGGGGFDDTAGTGGRFYGHDPVPRAGSGGTPGLSLDDDDRSDDEASCSCRVAGRERAAGSSVLLVLAACAAMWRRRR